MSRTYPPAKIEAQYRDALGSQDPIESMRKAPLRLRKLIHGRSKPQRTRRAASGAWSVKEVLAHLADAEMVFGTRLRFVAAMERPTIVGYDQNAFVANLAYDAVEVADISAEFAALRAMNVALLERLPRAAFTRIGRHSERGDESLVAMVFRAAGHDRIHEAQIARLLSSAPQRAPSAGVGPPSRSPRARIARAK